MGSLIDKGKVVDKIEDLFLDKYEANANKDLTGFFKEVLKILINEKGQLWISVKDGLPENDGKYLVCGKVALSNIHGEPIQLVRFTERKEWLTSLSVTHWMPLPQKPESEDEDAQNKVETREVEEYRVYIGSNDGYIAKTIAAYDLEDAKRQAIKYFSQDKGKTVVIRPKHSKKAVRIVIK